MRDQLVVLFNADGGAAANAINLTLLIAPADKVYLALPATGYFRSSRCSTGQSLRCYLFLLQSVIVSFLSIDN